MGDVLKRHGEGTPGRRHVQRPRGSNGTLRSSFWKWLTAMRVGVKGKEGGRVSVLGWQVWDPGHCSKGTKEP